MILLMEEIRRSPVEVGSFSLFLRVLYMSGGDRRISEPSTVSWICHEFDLFLELYFFTDSIPGEITIFHL